MQLFCLYLLLTCCCLGTLLSCAQDIGSTNSRFCQSVTDSTVDNDDVDTYKGEFGIHLYTIPRNYGNSVYDVYRVQNAVYTWQPLRQAWQVAINSFGSQLTGVWVGVVQTTSQISDNNNDKSSTSPSSDISNSYVFLSGPNGEPGYVQLLTYILCYATATGSTTTNSTMTNLNFEAIANQTFTDNDFLSYFKQFDAVPSVTSATINPGPANLFPNVTAAVYLGNVTTYLSALTVSPPSNSSTSSNNDDGGSISNKVSSAASQQDMVCLALGILTSSLWFL